MWPSNDLALVVFLAILNLVFTAVLGQLAWLVSGIPGSNMVFSIGYAILISFALLVFEGRRWRFFTQSVLIIVLTLPTYLNGPPFDVIIRMPVFLNALHGDLLFNSMYGFFQKTKRLPLWAILSATEFMLMNTVFAALVWPLFYSPEVVSTMLRIVPFIVPVIIIESLAGAYIGYKIYTRVKKINELEDEFQCVCKNDAEKPLKK